ncbi:helix-turn-helix domain-containing protein [Deinococcus soli (ex Cha et al. 2016)]|uniref:AlbA family DNA-binding domain-containing protein n=1 Tax=Deinococcus soli (ex Cha et al. 2016) TaxID=1309411 RepID=UPI00166A886D|nr:ATP-binding protein [Deinococcus soli (ex Cha et al. 2016)]GGB73698.1 hypothetical protein GCM10008019_32370 [Deinococcus soli (ex Cha et al. 2016)]
MTQPDGEPQNPLSADLHAVLAQALASSREESHYDFKLAAKKNIDLLTHIVAMSNLPQDTPGGRAFLIIGVSNARDVVGLNEEDLRSNPTADKRETHLNTFLRQNVDPNFTIRVHDVTIQGQSLHMIEIPCLGWPWRQLHREQEGSYGFWIRHGPNTVRPTRDQMAAEWSRQERRLQEQVIALEAGLTEQRQVALSALETASSAPDTSLQAIHVGFATPERTLLRLVRRDISTYLRAHSDGLDTWRTLPHFQLDRLDVRSAYEVHSDTAVQLRDVIERQEAAVRPLVELVGAIMHDADPTDRVRLAVLEIAQAVAFTAQTTIDAPRGLTQAALRFHPGYLLCFGASVAAMSVPDWTFLGIILRHAQPVIGEPRMWNLIQSIGLRPHMDALVLTFDHSSPVAAAAERARDLFEQPEWLGTFMPATLKKRITRHAEVILPLAFVAQARKVTSRTPFVDAAWLHSAGAQDTLRETLRMVVDRWDTMRDTPLDVVARQFDELAETGQWAHTVSAQQALADVSLLHG